MPLKHFQVNTFNSMGIHQQLPRHRFQQREIADCVRGIRKRNHSIDVRRARVRRFDVSALSSMRRYRLIESIMNRRIVFCNP